MFFHTVTCTCGWQYGPAKKRHVKDMLNLHKQIHILEKIANEKTKDDI